VEREKILNPKMKYNSDLSIRHKRQSTRLPTHNYGWSGTYFVTIRAKQREPIFEIPELRAILVEVWEALPKRFPNVTLDEFVIMPDHIHFIIELEGNVENPPTLGNVVGYISRWPQSPGRAILKPLEWNALVEFGNAIIMNVLFVIPMNWNRHVNTFATIPLNNMVQCRDRDRPT
jgi:REP element-mobilizing transposase RayT